MTQPSKVPEIRHQNMITPYNIQTLLWLKRQRICSLIYYESQLTTILHILVTNVLWLATHYFLINDCLQIFKIILLFQSWAFSESSQKQGRLTTKTLISNGTSCTNMKSGLITWTLRNQLINPDFPNERNLGVEILFRISRSIANTKSGF